MKVNPNQFDYVMYVDASGDDGFKFDKDSSVCYAAAAILVKQDDITHNIEILNQIKHIVGCKEKDEVKYSKIRRHRRGAEALSLLSEINGQLSCYIVFKKEVDAKEYIGNKHLSVVCHAMALRSIDSYRFDQGETVLVAIDRMKNTEEAPLKKLLGETQKEATVIFRDSKDADFLLIQIADLLCGSIREHFEQYETQEDMLYFSKKCPPCFKLFTAKRNTHQLCSHGRSRAARANNSSSFKYLLPLFPTKESKEFLDFFFIEPIEMMKTHLYLMCDRKK